MNGHTERLTERQTDRKRGKADRHQISHSREKKERSFSNSWEVHTDLQMVWGDTSVCLCQQLFPVITHTVT